MKKKLSTVFFVIVFLAGLSLLLYPTVSNYWNLVHQTRAIATYSENVEKISEEEYRKILEDARTYNSRMSGRAKPFIPGDEEKLEYENLLNPDGSGIMGYIEIESIDVSLPIYHGTSDSVLSVAVGHLDWSSLPVGGEGTHCVMSGHRGLPSAKLFTNLDKLMVGDIFVIRVLNETLTYEVDRIVTVEPDDVSSLGLEEGKDYCTLVTCTPYGINSHRLLVRGHRVPNRADSRNIRITSTAVQIKPVIVAAFIAVPLVIAFFIRFSVADKKRRRKSEFRKKMIDNQK